MVQRRMRGREGGAESESEGVPSDSDDSAMEVRVNVISNGFLV